MLELKAPWTVSLYHQQIMRSSAFEFVNEESSFYHLENKLITLSDVMHTEQKY